MEMNIPILTTRVYRDVMSYVYANNDFQGGTLLNRANFENFDFDLTKQKMDLKDGVTKLVFHYELSRNTAVVCNVYALVLHEREAELEQKGGKLLLRAWFYITIKIKKVTKYSEVLAFLTKKKQIKDFIISERSKKEIVLLLDFKPPYEHEVFIRLLTESKE